jgi:hypothetical protein
MGPIGNAVDFEETEEALDGRELESEPGEEEGPGGEFDEGDEKEYGNQHEDVGFGEEQEIGPQNTGDGAAGSDDGNAASGFEDQVEAGRGQAAEEIEEEESEAADPQLHIVAIDPQEEHVAQEVHGTRVEEHGGKEGTEGLLPKTRKALLALKAMKKSRGNQPKM